MKRGSLFIVSAPSGTGKTTLLKKIMAQMGGIVFSVSHTTRMPRSGEQDGVDYIFVDRDRFDAMRAGGAFLEWAEVHGNYYGTSRQAVDANLDQGLDVLLDIDVQGARQIREAVGVEGVFIFISPPSWEELKRRLTARRTDSVESVKLRCRNAVLEMTDSQYYDYVVVNNVVDEAVDVIRSIIIAVRSSDRRSPAGNSLHLDEMIKKINDVSPA